MIYLEKFLFPDIEHDTLIDYGRKGSFYDEHSYPFHITSEMGLWSLDFEPITILYGGNGSGKSTVINVISQKLCADRKSMFNSSPYFTDYVERCQYNSTKNLAGATLQSGSRVHQKYELSKITTVLTSDDIFHWMLQLRQENDRKLHKSYSLMDEYNNPEELPKHLNFETGENVEIYSRGVEIMRAKRSNSYSFNKLLVDRIGKIERSFSNGETALMKLTELIEAPGLYLLDEPENSMSCEFQMKLSSIIQYLARYGNCQFIIATHSPFILSMDNVKIYNLDHNPVDICKWWELDNMKRYFNLFYEAKEHFIK